MMESHIARWILEFLVRQPIEDRLINSIIYTLPLSTVDHRLMKTILLRRIFSEIHKGSISEKILDTLEIIEELDHRYGVKIMNSMKEAYCAIAVDCTVKFLRENSDDCRDYFDAVVKIWRGRILDMERCSTNVGLISDGLKDSRDEIEAALWSLSLRNKVLSKDTRDDAFKSIRLFLEEATEEMNPSFLEFAAAVTTNASIVENQATEERQNDLSKDNNGNEMDLDSSVEIRHMEKHTKYNVVPSAEVRKVREALKSSSLDLRAVVKDPLPDALRMAANLSSNMAREDINHGNSVENQNVVDMDVCDRSVEDVQVNQNACPKPSLMFRNNTARTYEWDDDSIESSHEGSPSRPNLPTPKNRAVSPLRKQDFRKITRRRKMKKWSSLEEQTLRDAVKEYGKGNWKYILDNYREIFEERTVVDLKDKWRNMTRY